MSTCNWLDLQTLGSEPIMPKNLPDLCCSLESQPVISQINSTGSSVTNCRFSPIILADTVLLQ